MCRSPCLHGHVDSWPYPDKVVAPRTVEQRIADTRRRLREDTDAWVASTDAARPWLIPLSFLWHSGRLLFATALSSPTAVNLRGVPGVRVALGGTRDVVLIIGDAEVAPSTSLTSEEVAAYQAKHRSDPRTWADGVVRVTPVRIQAWREENELLGRTLMRESVWTGLPDHDALRSSSPHL